MDKYYEPVVSGENKILQSNFQAENMNLIIGCILVFMIMLLVLNARFAGVVPFGGISLGLYISLNRAKYMLRRLTVRPDGSMAVKLFAKEEYNFTWADVENMHYSSRHKGIIFQLSGKRSFLLMRNLNGIGWFMEKFRDKIPESVLFAMKEK